ncbi:hypothetical protein Syun_029497 [Stephania yunnanensis]|uniref:Uncharacterized protein n=1 Tax=Stephania yunnanensis TaxID=152371 RepID=A0AAP0HG29_9MAGN
MGQEDGSHLVQMVLVPCANLHALQVWRNVLPLDSSKTRSWLRPGECTVMARTAFTYLSRVMHCKRCSNRYSLGILAIIKGMFICSLKS